MLQSNCVHYLRYARAWFPTVSRLFPVARGGIVLNGTGIAHGMTSTSWHGSGQPELAADRLFITQQSAGVETMSKEQRSNKEDKKKPAMTPKEKKAAKKARKESRGFLDTDRTR